VPSTWSDKVCQRLFDPLSDWQLSRWWYGNTLRIQKQRPAVRSGSHSNRELGLCWIRHQILGSIIFGERTGPFRVLVTEHRFAWLSVQCREMRLTNPMIKMLNGLIPALDTALRCEVVRAG